MVETARGEDRRGPATEYLDLVLEMRRTSRVAVAVQVRSSPAGAMRAPARVRFPAAESAAIHASLAVGEAAGYLGAPGGSGAGGGAQIGVDEAAALGERLAAVLFPPPVSRLVAESVALAARRPGGGLRIRLLMDASLVDLPWEYVQRPDRRTAGRLSSFLLLDHRISLVRQAADPRIAVRPISGRQRLAFVGTLWDGAEDGWGVGDGGSRSSSGSRPTSPGIRTATSPSSSRFASRRGAT